MKKVLLGVFVIGSLAFGCNESKLSLLKKADAKVEQTGKLIIEDMLVGIDGKNVGTKAEEIKTSVDEYIDLAKHIITEHKANEEEVALINKETEVMSQLMKEYKEYIKRNVRN